MGYITGRRKICLWKKVQGNSVYNRIKELSCLRRVRLDTLQVNMGNLCNQRCLHCHIDASAQGKNVMSQDIVDDVLQFLWRNRYLTLDITGGAPELNPNFDYFVRSAISLLKEIIVRSNLTVFFEPGKEYLPVFFKENKVHLICSLPCYIERNVDSQRGKGVFEKSIKALRILNDLGFAKGDGLRLDLVYNPTGANLPPKQSALEQEYRQNLRDSYGIEFNRLLAIANIPIGRFKHYLESTNEHESYYSLLENNFNPLTLVNLMCRSSLSVGWDGKLYDCDFNLALGLALKDEEGRIPTINTVDPEKIEEKRIIFGRHCLTCTAGAGSGCQGALCL